MKLFPRIWTPLLCAAAALALSGCATNTTPLARATNHPALMDSLTPFERERALRGEVAEGMSRDAVFIAWGRPDRITRGSEGGRDFEIWRYTELRPVYSTRIGVGFGGYYGGHYHRHRGHYHYHGGYYHPGYATYEYGPDYIPVTASVVKFRKGRVVSWEQGR